MKEDLLFYSAYEQFYEMAEKSNSFKVFCKDAFGEDFSQDGFSDINQINMIFDYLPDIKNLKILDVGCGNGKMLGYLQKKTNAHISGFDYSEKAISCAKNLFKNNADFRVGIIGEIEYPDNSFDFITSMDTMYFAQDMVSFITQIKRWLKPDGVLFVGYQEGEIVSKTANSETTLLANALRDNQMNYKVIDITQQTYEMLKRKRLSAEKYKKQFDSENMTQWYEMLMFQTESATASFNEYKSRFSRYIFVVENK